MYCGSTPTCSANNGPAITRNNLVSTVLIETMRQLRYSKASRLLNPKHFQSVFDNVNCKQSGPHFTFLAHHPLDLEVSSAPDTSSAIATPSRLGIIVAKRNVPTAVARNYIKRITRETFRQNVLSRPDLPKFDVIVLAKPACRQLNNESAAAKLSEQWQKLLIKIESRA